MVYHPCIAWVNTLVMLHFKIVVYIITNVKLIVLNSIFYNKKYIAKKFYNSTNRSEGRRSTVLFHVDH